MSLALSVLDQSPIREGGTAAQAIAESLELARLVDRLGYRRYWFADLEGTPWEETVAGLSAEERAALDGRVMGAFIRAVKPQSAA